MSHKPIRAAVLGGAAAAALFMSAVVVPVAYGGSGGDWRTGGYDSANSRNNAAEHTLDSSNVAGLKTKWIVQTGGDVSATPSVDTTSVYFPDKAGNIYAVDKVTGEVAWHASVPDLTGIANDYARTTPAIAGNLLIMGDQGGRFGTPDNPTGASVFALNKNTGAIVWRTQVDDHFSAIVTQSAQIQGGVAFIGVSSNEESYASQVYGGTYACCTFRGSMLALDIKTGRILWKTYMAPEGYSGASVWGSTPAFDARRGAVYVATGNNYSVPPGVVNCLLAGSDPEGCLAGDDHFDSIVALDAGTGAVLWATRGLASDVWNLDCGLGFPPFDQVGANCPAPGAVGPDFDFGQAPTLMTVRVNGQKRDVLGDGQKSGDYWMLDRDTGAVVWRTHVGTGGVYGGLQWGSAQDGTRIYVANSNSGDISRPGFWAALDPASGAILWQTADPAFPGAYQALSAAGAVSSANGVVYACTMNPAGTMLAMDAATGAVLWRFDSGGSCSAGAAISDGAVYWGSGYNILPGFTTGNNKLYAFGL